jgi:hypothetical protein
MVMFLENTGGCQPEMAGWTTLFAKEMTNRAPVSLSFLRTLGARRTEVSNSNVTTSCCGQPMEIVSHQQGVANRLYR